MQVNALNLNSQPFALIVHGPIRLTATSSHGAARVFLGGR